MSAVVKVVILMADYGHDPTEVAVPYTQFTKAGFQVSFATENGKSPQCDKKMLQGLSQKLLGANKETISLHNAMISSESFTSPLSWSSPSFSLHPYTIVFLPGGHEKSMRQILDSHHLRSLLASYFPYTRKPAPGKPGSKILSAICHGVQVISETTIVDGPHSGKSVLHDVCTTALPSTFEGVAYQGTRLWLGDYYLTYGKGSDSVESIVRRRLDEPSKQWKSSLSQKPFVVSDENYNYLSGRFPPDAKLLADKTIALAKVIVEEVDYDGPDGPNEKKEGAEGVEEETVAAAAAAAAA